jgi:CheY-like chemotaxis protein
MERNKEKSKILIVDDEKVNIDVLVGLLTPEYRVVAAKSGMQAFKRLEKPPLPDLILLDIMMPEMGGYEVCKRLKNDPLTTDIPVIFVTAKGETEDETRGLELGAIDYLTKPLSPPIVKARVDNHIELKLIREDLKRQNEVLKENMKLREDIEHITRHDLKTPLSGIISIPQILLSDDRIPSEHIKLLESMRKCGYQMLDMINQSLNMVKMEQGTYTLTPSYIDFHNIIKRAISDLKDETDIRKCVFKTLIDNHEASSEEQFMVIGEELLCYSMTANLIKNAVEASPREAVIQVCLDNSPDQGVRIQFNNQGMVPKEIQKNFFEKYVTSKKQGTGLGTYSARLIAETMKGTIQMQTDETTGTTITVCLPTEEVLKDILNNN